MTSDERYQKAAGIITKLRSHKRLTDEEIDYVATVLDDPLYEFAMREGTFRATSILGVDEKEASEHEDELGEVIFRRINQWDALYDTLDDDVREALDEWGIDY